MLSRASRQNRISVLLSRAVNFGISVSFQPLPTLSIPRSGCVHLSRRLVSLDAPTPRSLQLSIAVHLVTRGHAFHSSTFDYYQWPRIVSLEIEDIEEVGKQGVSHELQSQLATPRDV
jgi:hypothetical protein